MHRPRLKTRRDFIVVSGASAGFVCCGSLSKLSAQEGDVSTIIVDLSAIGVGQQIVVLWDNRRVFVRHRSPEEITRARTVPLSELKDPETDAQRAHNPEWIIVFGECTHVGCKPLEGLGDHGGWLCICHGSVFDVAGRVRSGPAATNLEIPPHRFLDSKTLEIGARVGNESPAD